MGPFNKELIGWADFQQHWFIVALSHTLLWSWCQEQSVGNQRVEVPRWWEFCMWVGLEWPQSCSVMAVSTLCRLFGCEAASSSSDCFLLPAWLANRARWGCLLEKVPEKIGIKSASTQNQQSWSSFWLGTIKKNEVSVLQAGELWSRDKDEWVGGWERVKCECTKAWQGWLWLLTKIRYLMDYCLSIYLFFFYALS